MKHLGFPWRFDGRGRTAYVDLDRHVLDLIEQVLFTSPGERVNRPDFGSGLARMPFEPLSGEVAAATQYLVQGALQQWLGEVIEVGTVSVEAEEARLRVTVEYIVRRTKERKVAQLARGA